MLRLTDSWRLRWTPRISILVAALAASACGDINISPTEPTWPFSGNGNAGIRHLEITGSLTAENGTCLEATILFDGTELTGGRVVCPNAAGCAKLDLAAATTSPDGRHTVSLEVVRQPLETTSYLAEIHVRLTREGLPFVASLAPEPIRATLKAGERVTFEFVFTD